MKNEDFTLLRDKCLLFVQFLLEKNTIPQELIPSYKDMINKINTAYQEKKVKPLKAMSTDIDDQVMRHMPLATALDFKNVLKEKLKIDYDIFEKKRKKIIEKIIRKRKIANREEYELIINRLDEIFADSDKADELKALNELLAQTNSLR
jgi:hypothetical protein